MVKRMHLLDGPYPDDHCKGVVYCADRYLELETLGNLKDPAQGESATLTETWEFYSRSEAEEELEAIVPGAG